MSDTHTEVSRGRVPGIQVRSLCVRCTKETIPAIVCQGEVDEQCLHHICMGWGIYCCECASKVIFTGFDS